MFDGAGGPFIIMLEMKPCPKLKLVQGHTLDTPVIRRRVTPSYDVGRPSSDVTSSASARERPETPVAGSSCIGCETPCRTKSSLQKETHSTTS